MSRRQLKETNVAALHALVRGGGGGGGGSEPSPSLLPFFPPRSLCSLCILCLPLSLNLTFHSSGDPTLIATHAALFHGLLAADQSEGGGGVGAGEI